MKKISDQIKLYLVTDEAACLGRDFFWVVEEAVKGGVTMVQLREKTLGTHAFIEKAKRLLDWEPQVRVEEGLERFIVWMKKEGFLE